MALQYRGDSNPVASTTSVTPAALPSGIAKAGDHALIVVTNKRATVTPDTPTGWALVASVQLGGGTPAAGNGPVRVGVYYQVVPSGTWALPSFAVSGTGAIISAGLMVWRTTVYGETLTFTTTSGSDTVADTAWSVTGDAVLPLTVGDALIAVAGITSNGPNLSAAALAATGATFGTLNNPWSSSSGSGDKLRSVVHRAPVTAVATGGVTGAPTYTATASQADSATGGALFIRLHSAVPAAHTSTGGALAAGAGGGVRAMRRRKAGGAPGAGAGGGRRTMPGHPTALVGGATAVAGGGGDCTVGSSTTNSKSGGAAATGAGGGFYTGTRGVPYAGGASASGGGGGVAAVIPAAVIAKSGGAFGRPTGDGRRGRMLHNRLGGATVAAGGGGNAVSSYQTAGGAAASGGGGGDLYVAVIPGPDPRPQRLLTLDRIVAGGHFDSPAPVTDGVEYVLTDITGWWGSPETRTDRTARLGAPGAHRRPAFKDVRSIAITITATADDQDPAAMRQAERVLAATCSDPDRLYLLRVDDQIEPTCAYVELDGAVAIALRDSLSWSSVVSVPVAAPDPRRFSLDWESVSTGPPVDATGGVVAVDPGVLATGSGVNAGLASRPSTVTVTGVGTAVRLPLVFEIAGAAEGDLTILDDSEASVLGYTGLLGPGDRVWINADDQPAYDVPGAPGPIPARGALLSNGSSARSAVTRFGPWPTLRPGDVVTYSLAGTLDAAARFTVHTRDAWI